jgi:hypothetical protein
MVLPLSTLGRYQPTHPVTWALYLVYILPIFLVWQLVLFTVGAPFILIGMVVLPASISYEKMRSRGKKN